MSEQPTTDPAQSDPAQIEADIETTRARLAGTVDELAVRIHPKEIARRGAEDAKTKVRAAATTPDGSPRVERLAAVGAALASLIGLAVWRGVRRRSSRSSSSRSRGRSRR